MKTLTTLFILSTSLTLCDLSAREPFLETVSPMQEPVYLPIDEIFPAQTRFASRNVETKVNNRIEKGDARWNSIERCWEYRYDQGRSIFSTDDAIPVVKATFGYVLTDGHHDVLSSLALEATWIPVKVIADLSHLTEEEFWAEAERRGFAYQYNLYGEHQPPAYAFHQLEDDPNRYFAKISARRYYENKRGQHSAGAEYPLWIKVGKDIPFIEFKIADILWQHNLIYSYEMGDNPPEEFIEAARQALAAAKIPGLRVVAERTHHSALPNPLSMPLRLLCQGKG